MKKIICLFVCLLGLNGAQAGVIMATGDTNIDTNYQFFNNVFGSQDVLSLNTGTSTWNTGNFTGSVDNYTSSFNAITNLTSNIDSSIDWLIAGTNTLYTNSQLAYILEFMGNGGNIFVAGEASAYSGERNAANQLLGYLGSSITVVDSVFSGTASALISNSYTSGAPTFDYGYSANLNGGTGLYGINDTYFNVAIENYSIDVPEPSALALFGLGLVGFGFSRKRKSI